MLRSNGQLTMTDQTGKLARWRLQLSELDYQNFHQANVKHKAADALSRLPTNGMDKSPLEDHVPVLTITEEPPEAKRTNMDENFWHSLPGMKL